MKSLYPARRLALPRGQSVVWTMSHGKFRWESEMVPSRIHDLGSTQFVILGLAATLALGLSQASAGPLATTNFALNDGFGPDAGRWHGSVAIAGAAFGDTLIAEVDWAVFGYGDFQLYLNSQGIAQADPSAVGEMAYVYQVASVTSASPGIDTLTVGVDPDDMRGVVSAPSFVPTGLPSSKAPAGGGDNTTSMAWFFNGSEFLAGDTSDLLVFTSPFLPEYDFLQVNSGLAGPVVSPLVASIGDRHAPEPSSLALGVLGSLGLFCRARKPR